MILNFKIKERTLSKLQDKNKDNLAYYKCKFYCDRQTWKNEEIIATFTNNMGYTKSVFLGKYEDVLSCTVPKNMIANKNFKVFLHSKSLKTNELSIYLFQKDDIEVERDQVIENVLQQIDTKIDNIKFENQSLKCYSNNRLISTVYIDNVDEAIVQKYVQKYFHDFEIEFQEQMDRYITEEDITFENGILYIK